MRQGTRGWIMPEADMLLHAEAYRRENSVAD